MSSLPRIALSLAAAALSLCVSAADGPYATYRTEAAFEEVMENLRGAIQERGLYINSEMHLGEMLERTGKDLGFEGRVYLKAESIEFCSATLSRRMVEEDPRRLVNCPFIVSVYVLANEPGKTVVAYRLPAAEEVAQSKAMAEVAAMLKGVAETAVAW